MIYLALFIVSLVVAAMGYVATTVFLYFFWGKERK